MKSSLYIYPHLGLGDMIICNGIVREKAREYDLVVVPSKYHNLESINFMFHDLANVCVRAVVDDEEAMMFGEQVWRGDKLYLGQHGKPPFVCSRFDSEFYRQANLSFQLRWDSFKVVLDRPLLDMGSWEWAETFVHDDQERGMKLTVPAGAYNHFRPSLSISRNIFAYIPVLQKVSQVHVINSSFALLIDSIDLPQNPRLFLHEYARSSETPTFAKEWIRLQQPPQ